MQRLIYSIFISFFLIISCAKSKPGGVVSEEKITKILTEVALVDGYLNTIPTDSAQSVMPVLYERIFQEYDLDSSSFVKNLDYYYGDPNLTEKIYAEVNKNLTVFERKYQKEDSTRQAIQSDSINRVHYFQRVNSKIENLKNFNSNDTAFKNYYEFNQRLMNNSNVEFLSSFFNLAPRPRLEMLSNDSLLMHNRNFKSPYIFVDTTLNNSYISGQFKVNSGKFLSTLGIYLASGNYSPTIQAASVQEVSIDRSSSEILPVSLDSASSGATKKLDPVELKRTKDRQLEKPLVKPVKAQRPQ